LAREDHVDPGEYRARLQSEKIQNMGRTLGWLATEIMEMMEKILGDGDSRLKKRRIARDVQLTFQ
jgi:hypothetical protein